MISPLIGFFTSSAATLPKTLSDKLTNTFPPSIISEIVTDDLFLGLYDALPYDNGESYLIDLSIDNLTLDILNNVNTSDIYSVDGEKVYEYGFQPINIENFFHTGGEEVEYYCSNDECDSYFVSSEITSDLEYKKYDTIELDYPTIISFGTSRQINKNKYVVLDLSSGFDDSFGNVKKWRFAFGFSLC